MPSSTTYTSIAVQPPAAPSPNCGRKSTQPCPGANDSECASGTNTPHASTKNRMAGTRTSPAPRSEKPLPRLRPSKIW